MNLKLKLNECYNLRLLKCKTFVFFACFLRIPFITHQNFLLLIHEFLPKIVNILSAQFVQ